MNITENIIKDRKIVEYHQIIVHNYWNNLSKVKYIVNLINDDKILKEQGFPTNLYIQSKKTNKSLACLMNCFNFYNKKSILNIWI